MLPTLLTRRWLGVTRNWHVTQRAFSPSQVSAIHQAFAQDLAANAHQIETLLATSSLAQFNEDNCVRAISLLRNTTDEEAVDVVLRACRKMTFSPSQLAKLCFGMAQNPRMFPRVPEFVLRELTARDLDDFSMGNLVMLCKSFALMKQRDGAVLTRVCQTLNSERRNLSACGVDDFALLLSSLAQLNFNAPPTLCARVQRLVLTSDHALLQRAAFRDIALLLDSLAKMNAQRSELVHAAALQVPEKLQDATARDIARMLNAFATSTQTSPAISSAVQALAEHVCANIKPVFSIPLLAGFAQVSAQQQQDSLHLPPALRTWFLQSLDAADGQLARCKAGELTLLLSSLTQLGCSPPPPARLVEEIARREASEFVLNDDLAITAHLLGAGEIASKLVRELEARTNRALC